MTFSCVQAIYLVYFFPSLCCTCTEFIAASHTISNAIFTDQSKGCYYKILRIIITPSLQLYGLSLVILGWVQMLEDNEEIGQDLLTSNGNFTLAQTLNLFFDLQNFWEESINGDIALLLKEASRALDSNYVKSVRNFKETYFWCLALCWVFIYIWNNESPAAHDKVIKIP